MSEKVFILGLGAQKSGTTWLHRYIESSGEAAAQIMKEFHVWDVRQPNHVSLNSSYSTIISSFRSGVRNPLVLSLRRLMQTFPSIYYSYFRLQYLAGAKICSDITPSYCSLTSMEMARIAENFQRMGVDVRFVFLIRDPISRCVSAAKMQMREEGSNGSVDDVLRARFRSPEYEARTRYDLTIREMYKSTDPNSIYVGVFEDMFSFEELKRLSLFLGVRLDIEAADIRVNRTALAAPVSDELCSEVANYYAGVYEYCAERYDRVRGLWPGFKYF